AVVVAKHRRAFAALRPVAAGAVFARGERRAVGLGAGENVVGVRVVAAPVHRRAFLGQRGLLVEVRVGVQVGDALRDHLALGVLPGALADAVLGVDRLVALRAQVGMPSVAARARRLRERLAVLVGAGEAAVVGAFAGAGAG